MPPNNSTTPGTGGIVTQTTKVRQPISPMRTVYLGDWPGTLQSVLVVRDGRNIRWFVFKLPQDDPLELAWLYVEVDVPDLLKVLRGQAGVDEFLRTTTHDILLEVHRHAPGADADDEKQARVNWYKVTNEKSLEFVPTVATGIKPIWRKQEV